MKVVSFKLPADMDRQLTDIARQRRSSRSSVVRDAITALGQSRPRSAAQAAGRLLGALKGGPRDLASNRKHLDGYGR